jgi:hypothetical protein
MEAIAGKPTARLTERWPPGQGRNEMRICLVVLVVVLGVSSPAWPQKAKDPGVANEERTQVEKATLTNPQAEPTPVVQLGIVRALDLKQGTLVLGHGDGTQSALLAPPTILSKIRIGDPVSVVIQGAKVKTVERLGEPSLLGEASLGA